MRLDFCKYLITVSYYDVVFFLFSVPLSLSLSSSLRRTLRLHRELRIDVEPLPHQDLRERVDGGRAAEEAGRACPVYPQLAMFVSFFVYGMRVKNEDLVQIPCICREIVRKG